MITIETATTALDFAYCSVKRLPAFHLYRLQEVALQYGNRGTTDDKDRAVAILDEVRQEQRRGLRKYRNMVIYPRLAADYHAIGRPDVAINILDETIHHSRSLLVRWEASVFMYVASLCNDIGEHERCDLLLRKVAEYVESVTKFGTSVVYNYWVGDLFSLYLRLGMVDDAESLAAKMIGSQRRDALATLAFHGQPYGQCLESILHTVMKHSGEYSKALVASLMIQNDQFGRATALLREITQSTYLRYEPMLEMVKCMLQRADASGALEMLDRLLATPHAVTIHSDHLGQICTMLQDSHGDMLHRVLDHVSRTVETNKSRLRRLALMAKLVRFLAPYSRGSAEAAVDQLLDSYTADLNQGAANTADRVPVALHTVAIAIDKHGLGWKDERREMFRQILARVPVPRRFEYADLLRPKIAVGSP